MRIRFLYRSVVGFVLRVLHRDKHATHQENYSGHSAMASLVLALTIMNRALDGVPIPGIQGAIAALLEVVRTLRHVDENAQEFAYLREKVLLIDREIVKPLSDPTMRANVPQSLQTDIENLVRDMRDIVGTCQSYVRKSSMEKFFGYAEDIAILESLNRQMDDALKWLTTRGVISLRIEAEAVRRRMITDLLNRLPHAQARYDAGVRNQASSCLEGTRTALLQAIQHWIDDDNPQAPQVFWLCGLAGTGKSTVAQTVAETLQKSNRLGASFFFSRDEAERRNPLLLFSSIAYQLAWFHTSFQRCIASSLESNPDLGRAVMRTQVEKLIIEPLQKVPINEAPRSPVFIVIDALDECNDVERVIDRIIILASELPTLPFRFKIFITSRADPHISNTFTSSPMAPITRAFLLHDIEKPIVKGDIRLYLSHHLTKIAERYSIPLPWPSQEQLTALVDRAGDLFIFAVTALKFISDAHQCDPQAQLDFLLAEEYSEDGKPYKGMNHLYLRILRESIAGEVDDTVLQRFQSVVGTLVVLQDPLSMKVLGDLLRMRTEAVRGALAGLHAVIVVPSGKDQEIRLIHPSFVEFLTSRKRCSDDRLFIDEALHDLRLAKLCLSHMTKTLKRDLCDIRDPSKFNSEITDLPERLKEHLPQHVKYACLYWASHLGKASSADDDIRICLTEFCETKLLQWMEVMSLLGDLPSAVHSLKLAEQYILASSSLHHLLHLVQDCHRFLLKYYEPISLSAAHIYYSALPFMPNSTLLETYGHEVGSSVRLLAGRKPSWSLCTRTLELGTGIAQSVTISPNGLTFASGHVNAVVRIWDVATGVVIMELNAHEKPITSVAYSPDGSIIASGSDDNSVRTWDVKTGKVGATWRGDDSHSDHRVICLTFSCDGRYIAFGSSNKLVRIWDLLQDPEAQYVVELKGHMGRITSLRFSPDGTQLATASNDHTVRIWTMEDVLRKEPEKVIEGVGNETNGEDSDRMKAIVLLGHFFSINSVRYSSDGARIVTGSDDRSIRIWDSRTGHQIRVIYCHTKVSTLTVVDDGDYHYIVSGCEDSTIRVFDASSGELRATLEGHFGRAESINLSLAHNLMISSSSDFTIRLWNWSASLRDARAIVPPRASAIVGVSFSPNGNWIGAASVDGKVQLYRRDGVLITTLDSEARSWDSGAGFLFSPDSSRILTRRLDDMLLHLWDTSDGALIARPDAEDQSVSLDRVCFSPNNALLAAWSDSNDILLWETVNGTPIVTLRGHVETIRSVAFSPDSRRLVSGSDDGRILVWDTMRHQLIMGLFGHDSPVVELMFSADGGVIMSRSKTKGFICWNAMTFKNIGGNPNTPVPYSSQTETGGRFNRGQWVGNWRIELEKDWMVLRSKPNAKGERMQKRLCWVPSTLRGRPLSSNRAEIRWDSHGSVAVCGVHTRRLAILDFSAMLELILGPRWNEE